jgi:hypothetical protein
MVTSEPVEVSVRVIILGVPLFWLAVKFGDIAMMLEFYPNIRIL